MRSVTVLLVCLVLAAGPALADPVTGAPADARPDCPAYSSASDPFDPSGDLALRLAALAKMESEAASLDGFQLYGLGALYRLGRAHPAALVDQDLAKARRYYTEASLAGQVEAYASMAELELAAGAPMVAMTWAQVYTQAERVRGSGKGLGYPASLIKRVSAAVRPGTRDEQKRQLAEFMQSHGEKFRARAALTQAAEAAPACRAVDEVWPISLATERAKLSEPRGRAALKLAGANSGQAMFHLMVDPDGSIASVRVIESVPTADSARALDGVLRQMSFNAVDASAPQRGVMVPLTLDTGEARLRD